MKKIIAVLLSLQLIWLSTQPAWADRIPVRKGVAALVQKDLPAGFTVNPGRFAHADTRLRQLDNLLLTNMRLPLSTSYNHLLLEKNLLATPRQILEHTNPAERALMLRSDFVALTLQNKVQPAEAALAASFYRENLRNFTPGTPEQAVQAAADIASLGVLGSVKEDAPLILQVLSKNKSTQAAPVFTAAAARALLRLGAYQELEQLSLVSQVQPDLWDGIAAYAKIYQLPLQISTRPDCVPADIADFMEEMAPLGPLNTTAIDPSAQATFLYMNAGRKITAPAVIQTARKPQATAVKTSPEIAPEEEMRAEFAGSPLPPTGAPEAPDAFSVLPQTDFSAPEKDLAALVEEHGPVKLSAENQGIINQAKQWLERLLPKSADDTKFSQRVALYLTAFSIGLEIGTPIMASIKGALDLPLSYAILVTAATFSPYLFGSFIANWLKGKIGRKGTINAGLGLMGGSLALGTTVLGLDGSFTAWENPLNQYFALLGVLTTLSTGAVFIHNATGPVMTEISHKTSELIRQKRGTYVEQSRAIGMVASFGFPFLATSVLGLDWSAPFVLALPIVGASALALNWAKLPNTKFVDNNTEKVRTSKGKLRSTTSYLHLLREAPGVGSFISGLFLMNAVEVALNSGFLFVLPTLTADESLRYLLGMIQYSAAFFAGRFLAKHFLEWFPKRNLSLATLLAATSSAASLGLTDNIYALTAALFTAELGISTTFTLAYARTAKDTKTQDKITSLIMASAVSCAVGPMLLAIMAQGLMGSGILEETSATIATLVGLPTALAFLSAKLFRRTESKTEVGLSNDWHLKETLQKWWEKLKNYWNNQSNKATE